MEEQLSLKLTVDPSQLDSFNRAVAEALATVKTAFGNTSSNLTSEAKDAISQFKTLEQTGVRSVDKIDDTLSALKTSFQSSATAMDALTNKINALDKLKVFVTVENSQLDATAREIQQLVTSVDSSNRLMADSFDRLANSMKTSSKSGTGSAKKDIAELSTAIRTDLLGAFQEMSSQSDQATKSVGNKVSAMSRDVRGSIKSEIGSAAEQLSTSINKMTKEIAESLAGVSTSIAEAAIAFKALAPSVGSATNEAEQELDQLAAKNKEVNRLLVAEAKFMAKTLSAQTRETIAAQKALFAGVGAGELQKRFAPSALENTLKLDLTQIFEPTARGELGSKFEDLWTELKGEFSKFEKRVEAEEARIASNRSALVSQKLKEIGDTEKAAMQTRAALVEQKLREIGLAEQQSADFRAAMANQKLQEIGTAEKQAADTRAALVDQKLKEIAQSEAQVLATRKALVEQKLSEILQAERQAADTRAALVDQRLRQIAVDEKNLADFQQAMSDQKLREIADRDQKILAQARAFGKSQVQIEKEHAKKALEARLAMDAGLGRDVAVREFGGDIVNVASLTNAEALRGRLESLDGSSKKLSKSFGDLHSAARGVASGFNAMWLTWGNIGPLLAGAAISSSFVQAAKQGAALNRELDFIRVLGGESETTISNLKSTLISLGQEGLAGPQEVAEAMKTLALAGLGAEQQMLVIRDTLNLATVGALDLKDAAEAIVGIGTAFGVGFESLGRVGDIISKAASLSQASVESIKNSMATASVVAEQYGLTLEDTATALTILAKRNITGTAAGTALRNMLNELTGSSNLSRKALDQLGFKALDASGKVKPLEQMITELSGKLKNYNGESFQRFLKEISNERGGKALSALLVEIQKVTNEGGKDITAFRKIFDELTESYGFNAIAAAELSTTTEKEFKKVKNALDTALLGAFDRVEPELRSIALELRKTFASEEFKQALDSLVVGLGQFILILVESKDALINVAIAYGIFKGAMLSKGIFDAANKGVGGLIGGLGDLRKNLAATQAASLAQVTAGAAAAGTFGAMGVAATTTAKSLLRFLPGIGTLLWIGVEAWDAYGNSAKRALDAANGAKNSKFNSITEYYENEIANVNKQNKLLEEKLGTKGQAPAGQDLQNLSYLEVQRDKELLQLNQKYEAERKNAAYSGQLVIEKMNSARQLKRIEQDYVKQVETTNKTFDDRVKKTKSQVDELVAAKKRNDELAQKTKPEAPAGGTQTYKGADEPAGEGRSANFLKQALDEQLRRSKEFADRELNVLREKNRGKTVSDLEYYSETEKINRRVELESIALIEKEIEATKANTKIQGEAREESLRALDTKLLAAKTEADYRLLLEKTKKAADENLRTSALQAKLDDQRAKTLDELAAIQEDFENQSLPKDELERLQIRQKITKEYAVSLAEQESAVGRLQKELEDYYASGKELSEQELLDEANKITARLGNVEAIKLQRDELIKLAVEQQRERERLKNDPTFAGQQAVNQYFNNLDTVGQITNRVVSQSLKQFEDALVEATKTGKLNIKSLFNTLKDEVRRAAVQQILMPKIRVAIEAVVGSVTGNLGDVGGIATALGAGGFGGGLGALAALQGGFSGNAFESSAAAFGGAATRFATSNLGESLGLFDTAEFLSTGSGFTEAGLAFTQGAQALGEVAPYLGSLVTALDDPLAGAGQAAGTYLGATFGPLGAYIGGQVGKLAGETLNKVLGISGGEERAGGSYRLKDGQTTFVAGPSGGQLAADNVTQLTDQTIAKINQSLKALGSTSYITDFVSGLETSTKGRGGVLAGGTLSSGVRFGEDGSGSNYDGTYYESTSAQSVGAEDAFKLYVQDLNQAFLQALVAESQTANAGIKENVKGYLAGLGNIELMSVQQVQAAMNTLEVLNQVNTNFGAMKTNLAGLANASIETLQAFFTLSGGIEGLSQGLSSFMQTFYSEQERADISTQNAVKALKNFESAGLDMSLVVDESGKFLSGARSELRKFTEGLDLTTRTGYEAYLGMLGLSQALGTVLPEVEDVQSSIKELRKESRQLSAELLEAQGNTDQAKGALRALAIEGMSVLEVQAFDLNEALREQIRITEERKGVEDELSQLQDDVAVTRLKELAALDPTNRALKLQVFAFQDLATAAQKAKDAQDVLNDTLNRVAERFLTQSELFERPYNQIISTFAGLGVQVSKELIDSFSIADFRKEYEDALKRGDKVAADAFIQTADAFLKIKDIAKEAADKLAGFGKTIKEFALDIESQVEPENAAIADALYKRTLGQAQGNDENALGDVTNKAQGAIDAARSSSKSFIEFKTKVNQVKADLLTLPAVKSFEQQSLEALAAIKAEVASLGDAFTVELTATAKSEIEKLITYVTNTDDLPDDLKELALAQASTLTKLVNYIVGSQIPEDLKQLALSTSSILTRTVDAVLKANIDLDAKRLGLSETNALLTTVQATISSDVSTDTKKLALGAVNTLLTTVQAAVGANSNPDALRLGLLATNTLRTTVDAVLASTLNPEAKALALNASSALIRTVNAALGSVDPVAKDLALRNSETINKAINALIGSSWNEDAKRLAFAATESITKTVNAALGANISDEARRMVLASSDSLTRTVIAAAGSLDSNAMALIFAANATVNKTVQGALASGSNDALSLALKQSETVNKTIQGIINTGSLSETQAAVLRAATGTSNNMIEAELMFANSLSPDGGILAYSKADVASAYTHGGKFLSHWLSDIAEYTFRSAGHLEVIKLAVASSSSGNTGSGSTGSTGATGTSAGSTGNSSGTGSSSTNTQPLNYAGFQEVLRSIRAYSDGQKGAAILYANSRGLSDSQIISEGLSLTGDSSFSQAGLDYLRSVADSQWNGLKFREGGFVSGPGTATSDSIKARLSNGEFVLRAKAVKQIGVDTLNYWNSGMAFSEGGAVSNSSQTREPPTISKTGFAVRANSTSNGMEALLVKIEVLTLEVKRLRADNSAENFAIAGSVQKTAKILNDVTDGGNAVITVSEDTLL